MCADADEILASDKVLALTAIVFRSVLSLEVLAGILHQCAEWKAVVGVLRFGDEIGVDHVGFVEPAVYILIVAIVEIESRSFNK